MSRPIQAFDKLAVAFAIVLPTLVTFVYFVLLEDSPARLQQTAYAIGKSIQFVFPVAYVWLFHRHRLPFLRSIDHGHDLELPANQAAPNNWLAGAAFGLLVVASMFVVWFALIKDGASGAALTEAVQDKVAGMQLDSTFKFLMLGLFYAIFHSFMEEYYWRWFVFERLNSFTSTITANLISSFGFAAHHVIVLATFFGWSSPLTWLFSFGVAVGGMAWAWLYSRNGKLSAPWVSHMIVDAGIFALGYLIVFK